MDKVKGKLESIEWGCASERSGFWTFQSVALEPFPAMSVEKNVKSGFTTIRQKTELTPLKVIFDTEDQRFRRGDIAYVMADQYSHPWGKAVYEVGDEKFVLAPLNVIQGLKRP